MKPCVQNRKLIVWLTLNALDARQTRQLRAHLETCEGCRRYLAEISNVTERLAEQENLDIQAPESFHRKVAKKLQAVESGSIWETLAAGLREMVLNWRVALPATAALVIAILVLVVPRQHPDVSVPAPPTIRIASTSSPSSDLAPTLANYQMVASQSLTKLDELLTKQGNKRLPPAPIYTASTLKLANASF
jgi:anti-sigma factor RsiW